MSILYNWNIARHIYRHEYLLTWLISHQDERRNLLLLDFTLQPFKAWSSIFCTCSILPLEHHFLTADSPWTYCIIVSITLMQSHLGCNYSSQYFQRPTFFLLLPNTPSPLEGITQERNTAISCTLMARIMLH